MGIMYQKDATPKSCPKKLNGTKIDVEGKMMYAYILSIFRM